MTNKIIDILGYESTKTGATIILKFNTGYITKRKATNVIIEHVKKCALSGEEIPIGNVAYYIAIKKQSFPRIWLSQEAVNKALSGDYHEEVDSSPDIVKALLGFLDDCQKERKDMIKGDKELRAALANLKFKNSKLGAKMSATHKLLELVSVKK